ncbi:MAG: penicillin-binding transpeptidase domain-containing protein [Candidatus Omnitrophota bacterium]
MYISDYRRRTQAAFSVFFVLFGLSLSCLFYIQFFRSQYLSGIAKKQHNYFMELEPRRGAIYDTNLKPQAVNLAFDSVYAAPKAVLAKDKEKIVRALTRILNLDEASLRSKLARDKSFIWLARKISPEQSEAIKALNLKGVGFIKESKRSYPNGYLASQLIGFAGMDNNGQEGVELLYDEYLKGTPGWALLLRDARSKKINLYEKIARPKEGDSLILTIDEVIQYVAERELDKAYSNSRAKGASIVVMNPNTGEILAMANRPTFDLNNHSKNSPESRRNRAVCDMFEPGSVFKIVTASAALEENKVREQDKFFCENGKYKIANHILHDHTSHGWLTFQEVIEQSSNIGTCKVAQILGQEGVHRYVNLFGFGKRTGVDLPGEIPGQVKPLRLWSKTSIFAVPMGQEVGVTAIQLASAISVIANGGNLMKPYIVKEIRDSLGEPVKVFSPEVIRNVLSPESAARVKKILIGVTENGTGKMARIPDFTSAGKTGTAQKIEPNGAYSHSKFVASFIGFAPAEDPQIAVVVIVDEPKGAYFGGVVSAPVFKNVSADVLRYLKTRKTANEVLVLNESIRAN